jgi:hypothetical protein
MPRIKTTATVRVALWAVRIYLLILLTLIGVKFVRVIRQGQHAPGQAAGVPAAKPKADLGP